MKHNFAPRSGASIKINSSHGSNETWWPVLLSEEATKRAFDEDFLVFSKELDVWLKVNVGIRNRWTRDDPKPEYADWQYYYSSNGPVFWFKNKEAAFLFKMFWS